VVHHLNSQDLRLNFYGWPSLPPPNEKDISQKNSVGPSKGLEQLSQLSSFLATDLGGTNIPRRGKRQNPTKRSASLK